MQDVWERVRARGESKDQLGLVERVRCFLGVEQSVTVSRAANDVQEHVEGGLGAHRILSFDRHIPSIPPDAVVTPVRDIIEPRSDPLAPGTAQVVVSVACVQFASDSDQSAFNLKAPTSMEALGLNEVFIMKGGGDGHFGWQADGPEITAIQDDHVLDPNADVDLRLEP